MTDKEGGNPALRSAQGQRVMMEILLLTLASMMSLHDWNARRKAVSVGQIFLSHQPRPPALGMSNNGDGSEGRTKLAPRDDQA